MRTSSQDAPLCRFIYWGRALARDAPGSRKRTLLQNSESEMLLVLGFGKNLPFAIQRWVSQSSLQPYAGLQQEGPPSLFLDISGWKTQEISR